MGRRWIIWISNRRIIATSHLACIRQRNRERVLTISRTYINRASESASLMHLYRKTKESDNNKIEKRHHQYVEDLSGYLLLKCSTLLLQFVWYALFNAGHHSLTKEPAMEITQILQLEEWPDWEVCWMKHVEHTAGYTVKEVWSRVIQQRCIIRETRRRGRHHLPFRIRWAQ